MRSLDAEEEKLWAKVTRSIEPLSREPERDPPAMPRPVRAPVPSEQQRARAASATRRQRPTVNPAVSQRHQDATLDGGWDRKLRQGKVTPDRVIDLHGQTLDGAWGAIDRGLERAIGAGDRLILLVTGHAPKGAPPVERGKIRGAVEDWLAASRHAGVIAAVRPAASRHGGRGALYLVLRRLRD